METKRNRKRYDLEYKKRIVAEYLAGELSAQELASERGCILGRFTTGNLN